MNELLGLIRQTGVARLAAIIGVTAGVAIALAMIMARIGEPPLSILYADLDFKEAQAVVERLDQEGVRYETREVGGYVAVLAPRSELSRLKISLAADGVVRQSGVGWEIFDKSDAFGSTSFQQNINKLRALEGELARTISSIEGVRSARVHLVLPERDLFARDKKTATASIVVDAPRGLDQRSVQAIVNLAASAAPELSPSRVTILDSAGNLLASGQNDDALVGSKVEERIAVTEARLRKTVEDIVSSIVGDENLRVRVAAEMDFNRVTESAQIIDPDSQTVLSSITIEEAADQRDPSYGRGVTVANALPGAQQAADAVSGASSANRRTEETTNYEMTRTTRSEVREQGALKRISVAVALNQIGAPRAPEEIARISTLVKSAVGFTEARGDRVEVVEIAFNPLAAPETVAPPAPASAGLSQGDAMRLAELGALGLIGMSLVVFVLRPMLSPKPAGATAALAALEQDRSTQSAYQAPSLQAPAFDQKIDLARVEGQVRASSVNKVSEVVKGHTDESIGILKNWIRQAS